MEHLASLAKQGSEWVSLSSIGAQGQVLGEINSRTYAIRLRPGVQIVDRQVVVLSPPESRRG
ncbi:transcriptional regulator [Ktedonobacter racemifer]|uniref:transcriptional regulator n=1 Tax=Ktedonobacter racemifer TaxID=363277 RepID=UPI001FCA87BF|nr:transcriptional regulator [Ktedonobacter racemifer]